MAPDGVQGAPAKVGSSLVGAKIGSDNFIDAILNTNPSTPPNVSPGGLVGSLASGGMKEILENIDMIGEEVRSSRSQNATRKK
ncbi:hypothetical protein [Maridesulfovibrio sp.]|uniref:hypothetical protein n=1 Tax=Maridesulfovibrio sp. TaxID=2795000 RepID=UPI002A18CBB2|nr:hypothetical protein [Maridesulfovibrio sp.]